jgi:hypothetical protein
MGTPQTPVYMGAAAHYFAVAAAAGAVALFIRTIFQSRLAVLIRSLSDHLLGVVGKVPFA